MADRDSSTEPATMTNDQLRACVQQVIKRTKTREFNQRLAVRVAADDLLGLVVHPLADLLPALPPDEIEPLGRSLARRQAQPIIVCRGYLVDGRSRIRAAMLIDLVLYVEYRDELSDHELEDLIVSLHREVPDLTKKRRIEIAATYYERCQMENIATALSRAAKLLGVSKRSVCRYREANGIKLNRRCFSLIMDW